MFPKPSSLVGWAVAIALLLVTVSAPSQPSPGIEGPITADKAIAFLYPDPEPDVSVDVYATQNAVIDGKQVWFLYTTSNTKGNDCHACSVTLGAAMFEKEGTRWIKRADDRYLGAIGSFGVPLKCEPVKWGKQAYGLIVYGGWVGYGQLTELQTLWAFENGSFRQLFTLQLADNNGGSLAPDNQKYGWAAHWKFGTVSPNGFFDLVITLDPRNSYPNGPDGRKNVPVPGVYRYDGKVYRHLQKKISLEG